MAEPPLEDAAPRLTVRRLLGLDRSGPPPPQTQAGQPLRPWTIPNAIGFVRLALIPVFLIVALSSSDGVGAPEAALFAVIGWGDYADGIAARVTGQYSRLGALMDPVTDRLLVISGVVVSWRFELLPRWALAVLAARELSMLAIGRYGLAHGVRAAHQLARAARGGAGDGLVLLRDGGAWRRRRGAAVRRPRAGAPRQRPVCAHGPAAAARRKPAFTAPIVSSSA